ncbi:MAG TPA: ABC transporter substrate-binding protein [Candidatus Limnocylindrales bacterium]|nr:ABC transporter substrate-binding protein [Candidatus Limnocylindrales bacterium]
MAALGPMLAACGQNATTSGASPSACGASAKPEQTNVTFAQEWLPWAAYAPEWTAQEHGYYKAEGLNVNIITPASGSDPVRLVGTGKAEFGVTQPATVIVAAGKQGLPIESVGATLRREADGLFYNPDSGIKSPQDLKGKTIGVNPIPNALAFTNTLLASAGLTKNDVKIVDPGFSATELVLTNKIAAGWGFVYFEGSIYKLQTGKAPGFLLWTDYGVPSMYQQVVIANTQWLPQHPCTAAAFMRATRKGLEDFLKNPQSITPVMTAHNQATTLVMQNQMAQDSAYNWTDNTTKAHGVFYQDLSVWTKAQQYMKDQGMIDTVIDPNKYFTNAYLDTTPSS